MKTTTVHFGNFAQDAMTLTQMNFLMGGGSPDIDPVDLITKPGDERPSS